jgi:hypothetical protein
MLTGSILWLALSGIVGVAADTRGRFWLSWVLLSLAPASRPAVTCSTSFRYRRRIAGHRIAEEKAKWRKYYWLIWAAFAVFIAVVIVLVQYGKRVNHSARNPWLWKQRRRFLAGRGAVLC